MANPPPPPPAFKSTLPLLLLLLISSTADTITSTTNSQDFSAMLEALRNRGYTLFTNAITTSDLQYQLLTITAATATAAAAEGNLDPTSRFTLFAPKDELLYALDMATDAAVYISTLRYHVIPNHRHTFADLQNLSSPFLDTLLPHYAVLIGKVQDGGVSSQNATVAVMVDGVRVSIPDLFIGSRIAVHGIDGILLTGLNMNQAFEGNDNGSSGIFPPVESPAPGLHRNIPAERTHAPMSQFDWSVNGPATPVNIPAEGTPPPPISQFDRSSVPPTPANIPAEGTLASPTSQFGGNNVPVAPASTFDGNIPAKGTLSTPKSQFDGNTVQGLDGNIPAATTPKVLQDQIEKLRSLKKKKRGKRHRKGRRHHRRNVGLGDHRLGDL